jgi:Flp pilus assembly protein TadD
MILDALRGRSRSTEADAGASNQSRADSVLRTLGYSPRRNRSRRFQTRVLYGTLAVLIGFVGLSLIVGTLAPRESGTAPRRPSANAQVSRPVQSPAPSNPGGAETLAPAAAAASTTPTGVAPDASGSPAPRPGPRPVLSVAARRKAPVAPDRPVSTPADSEAPPVVTSQSAERPVDDFRVALDYQRRGDYAGATSSYAKVTEKQGPNPAVQNNEAVMWLDRRNPEAAIRELENALKIEPGYVKAQNNLGVALLNAGRIDEARNALNVALAKDPRNVESMVNLALVHRAAGNQTDARALLQRAVAADPRSAGAHYNLAVVADASGDPAAAAEHYRAFLRLGTVQYASLVAPVRERLSALGR